MPPLSSRPRGPQATVGIGLAFGLAVIGLGLIGASNIAEGSAPADESPDPDERPVLLIVIDADDELGAAVAQALQTELNDVDVVLEPIAMTPTDDLRGRIVASEQLVREHGALGLVWIEASGDELVVHLVVADAGMLRRPLAGLADRAAAIETAAVVVRHFVVELLAGRPIGLTPTDPRPDPDPAIDEPAPIDQPAREDPELPADDAPDPNGPKLLGDRGHFRLGAGYLGQTWIRERAWESGVEINVGWRFAVGAHVGIGAGFTPAFEAELTHPGNLGVAQLRARRYPVSLVGGYQHVWSQTRLALDVQLRVSAEIVERGVFDPDDITPQLDRPIVVTPALEPRVGLDYLAIPQLAVFVAVGLRANLVEVDYRVDYTDESGAVIGSEEPLHPRIVSPVVLAGLDMFF